MSTIHILDNDIVLKTARYGLFNELFQITNGQSNIRILSAIKYRFFLNNMTKSIELSGSDDCYYRLKEFIETTSPLPVEGIEEEISKLSGIQNIDSGEILLFAYNLFHHTSVTFTGDKRAIIALTSSASIEDLIPIISGRIYCYEQVMAKKLMLFDFNDIRNKVLSDPNCDKALNCCFQSNKKEDVLGGLQSYYNHLNSAAKGLLAPFPLP